MTKVADDLVECRRCGSDACYQIHETNYIRWQCMDCGFYTNTLMLAGSQPVKFLQDDSPELIKDLLYTDEDGFVWAPLIINKPGIGILFPDGTSADSWRWSFAPEVLIPEEQRHRYPVKGEKGAFHTHKVDMSLVKHYDQNDYIVALQDAGLLNSL